MILVTAGEMQEMDRQTIENHGIPGLELMENAGRVLKEFVEGSTECSLNLATA